MFKTLALVQIVIWIIRELLAQVTLYYILVHPGQQSISCVFTNMSCFISNYNPCNKTPLVNYLFSYGIFAVLAEIVDLSLIWFTSGTYFFETQFELEILRHRLLVFHDGARTKQHFFQLNLSIDESCIEFEVAQGQVSQIARVLKLDFDISSN